MGSLSQFFRIQVNFTLGRESSVEIVLNFIKINRLSGISCSAPLSSSADHKLASKFRVGFSSFHKIETENGESFQILLEKFSVSIFIKLGMGLSLITEE